jgi:hypothetical protein
MISRDHLSVDIMNLLGRIFLTPLSKNASITMEARIGDTFALMDLFSDQVRSINFLKCIFVRIIHRSQLVFGRYSHSILKCCLYFRWISGRFCLG